MSWKVAVIPVIHCHVSQVLFKETSRGCGHSADTPISPGVCRASSEILSQRDRISLYSQLCPAQKRTI
jgi:hypothetical protein